jgi:hypothetical protein
MRFVKTMSDKHEAEWNQQQDINGDDKEEK